MTIDKVILFSTFLLGYSLVMKYYNYKDFTLKGMIKSKLGRTLIIITVFCVTVYFQGEFSEADTISLNGLFFGFMSGGSMATFFRFIWASKFS